MLSSITIQKLHFFRGNSARLSENTAVLTFSLVGDLGDWPALEQRLRTYVPMLRPGEPLWNVEPHDWPTAFLDNPDRETPTFAHWIAAFIIAFQRWARDPVWAGRVIEVSGKSASLALPWVRESVLQTALQFALRHLLLFFQPEARMAESAARLADQLDQWLNTVQPGGLPPNTLRFALAAHQRRIPVTCLSRTIQLGWGANAELLDSSFTGRTSQIATNLAKDKFRTKLLLGKLGLPVPQGALVHTWEQALNSAKEQGWPVVVKPFNRDQGMGVVPGIQNETSLRRAFDTAAKFSGGAVIVEKHIGGHDYRMLVVGDKLWITTRRTPGGITADGKSSVAQLIERVNADPRRGRDKRSMLITLTLDEEAIACLAEQSLSGDSIPEAGHFVHLRLTANISTGGTADDVTESVSSCGAGGQVHWTRHCRGRFPLP
jgi:cyanophycin synthetase